MEDELQTGKDAMNGYTQPPKPPILTREWNTEMDRITDSHEIAADKLEVLYGGERAFEVWRDTLLKAEKSIRLYTYYFKSAGKTGKELLDILERKARAGVTVRILAARYAQLACGLKDVLRLRRAGCEVILAGNIWFPFPGRTLIQRRHRLVAPVPEHLLLPLRGKPRGKHRLVDCSLHVKVLVTDGATAIAGGRNIHENYFRRWEDADLYVTGAAAGELAQQFDREFASLGGKGVPEAPPLPIRAARTAVMLRPVISTPWKHRFTTLNTLIHAVSSARRRIDIMTQYIVPPKPLQDALTEAARRGVEVHLITNSLDSGKAVAGGICWYLSSNWYPSLLEAGIHIHEWRGIDRVNYLHTKLFLIDRSLLAIGSFNLSVRSSYLESESLFFLHDRPCLDGAAHLFTHALEKGCTEVTTRSLEGYSSVTRLLQRAAMFFRIYY